MQYNIYYTILNNSVSQCHESYLRLQEDIGAYILGVVDSLACARQQSLVSDQRAAGGVQAVEDCTVHFRVLWLQYSNRVVVVIVVLVVINIIFNT